MAPGARAGLAEHLGMKTTLALLAGLLAALALLTWSTWALGESLAAGGLSGSAGLAPLHVRGLSYERQCANVSGEGLHMVGCV